MEAGGGWRSEQTSLDVSRFDYDFAEIRFLTYDHRGGASESRFLSGTSVFRHKAVYRRHPPGSELSSRAIINGPYAAY